MMKNALDNPPTRPTSVKKQIRERTQNTIEYANNHPRAVEATLDTGAQFTCLHESAVRILNKSGHHFKTTGVGSKPGTSNFEKCDVATVLILENGNQIIAYLEGVGVGEEDTLVREAQLVDPCQLHQAGHYVNIFDNDGGLGGITLRDSNNTGLDGKIIPFIATEEGDIGFVMRPPTKSEMKNLPIVTLTISGYSRKQYMEKYKDKQYRKATFTMHNLKSTKPTSYGKKYIPFLKRINSIPKTNSENPPAEQVTLDEINPTIMAVKMSSKRRKQKNFIIM